MNHLNSRYQKDSYRSSSLIRGGSDVFSLFPSLCDSDAILNIEVVFSFSVFSDCSFGQFLREWNSNWISGFHYVLEGKFSFRIADILVNSLDSFFGEWLSLFMMGLLSEILCELLSVDKLSIWKSLDERMCGF